MGMVVIPTLHSLSQPPTRLLPIIISHCHSNGGLHLSFGFPPLARGGFSRASPRPGRRCSGFSPKPHDSVPRFCGWSVRLLITTCSFHSGSASVASAASSSSSIVSHVCEAATTRQRQSSEILRIREALLSRERSALEITEEYLSRLRDIEPHIKSFLFVSEVALKEAEELDRKIAGREELGPLAGVPVGVKDNLCTHDMPSTGGSKILEGYRPPFDAAAVRKLREAGAVLIGKTNLDDFGMGSSTESSAFQVTCNPWDVARVPGGSSGGSAAAVAARQCACALGSDTGGSIRQPASFCGVVGLKPSYGRISRFGLMAFASSLDVVGCLCTSVMDAAIVLEVIAGHDSLDATSSSKEVSQYAARLIPVDAMKSRPLDGLRIGLVKETIGGGIDTAVSSAVAAAANHLEGLGASISEVSLPSFSLGLPAYYILASSEASSNLARYDGIRYGPQVCANDLISMYMNTRAHGFGAEVKRRSLMGTYALSAGFYDAFYKRAQQVRTLIQDDFKSALKDNNLLISPAAPTVAYHIGEKVNDPLSMYAGDIATVNANLAGLPSLVVPCGFGSGFSEHLPVGLQFIGNAFGEEHLLQVGHIFEQTLQCSSFVPPLLKCTSCA